MSRILIGTTSVHMSDFARSPVVQHFDIIDQCWDPVLKGARSRGGGGPAVLQRQVKRVVIEHDGDPQLAEKSLDVDSTDSVVKAFSCNNQSPKMNIT